MHQLIPIRSTDVVLVQPPVTWLTPSLALSILKGSLNDVGIAASVDYGSHFFVQKIGYKKYKLAERLMDMMTRGWEIMFSKYAGFETAVSYEDLISTAEVEINSSYKERFPEGVANNFKMLRKLWREIDEIIPEYLSEQADRILESNPTVVGLSIMTEQRNAAFAICREIKKRNPSVITILGGGVCTADVGEMFLTACPQLDYVYIGEGDRGFAEVCKYILDGHKDNLNERFPFMLTRGKAAEYAIFTNMDDCPVPDYSDYFEAVGNEEFGKEILRLVPVESSRGCWWRYASGGCRFCGLHYCHEASKYREKSTEKFWHDIDSIYEKYHFAVFQLADCIVSRGLIHSLPEKCPEHRKKYRFFAECRTDLNENQIKLLAENGFLTLQPGIEAIQDDFLKQMNKGRTTIQHLQFLKNCEKYGIKPVWNILLMVPGDKAEWYVEQIQNMKKILHFHPPQSINDILFARGSEFTSNHKAYGIEKLQLRFSDKAADPMIDGFTETTTDYYFNPAAVFRSDLWIETYNLAMEWKKNAKERYLTYGYQNRKGSISDGRFPESPQVYECSEDAIKILDRADQIVSMNDLYELDIESSRVDEIVKELVEKDVIYRSEDKVLCLAMAGSPN